MRSSLIGIVIGSITVFIGCSRKTSVPHYAAQPHPGIAAQFKMSPQGTYTVVCPKGATAPGMDISNYSPGTNWNGLSQSGLKFAFIKATNGSNFQNQYFQTDWAAAKSVHALRGAYHFFEPQEDPVAQAQNFLQTMGTSDPNDLPPVLDWEVSNHVSPKIQIQRALIWLQLVERATGKAPLIYTGYAFWNSLGNPSQFSKYPLFVANWRARCPKVPPPWKTWAFWQTGPGSVPGVQTNADLDLFNGPINSLFFSIARVNSEAHQ